MTVDRYLARGNVENARQALQKHGFAASRTAHNPHLFSVGNVEGYIFQHLLVAERQRDVFHADMRAGRSAERFGIFPYPAFHFEEVFQSSQRDRLTLHIADVLADLGNMAHDLHDVGARGRQRTHHQGAVEDEKNADNDGRYVGDLHKAVEKGVVLCHFIVQTEHYVPHAIIVAAELFLLVRLVGKRADQPHAADIFLNGEIDIAVRAAHVRENDFHRPCVADQRKDERG